MQPSNIRLCRSSILLRSGISPKNTLWDRAEEGDRFVEGRRYSCKIIVPAMNNVKKRGKRADGRVFVHRTRLKHVPENGLSPLD
jgi:hypothetical protein